MEPSSRFAIILLAVIHPLIVVIILNILRFRAAILLVELNWDRETKSDFVLIPLTGSWVASCNICDNTESGQAPQAAVTSSGCSLRRKSSTFESPMVHASNNNQRGMPNLIGKWMMSEQSKTWHVLVANLLIKIII